MYAPTRRGRLGIAAAAPAGLRPIGGPDINDHPVSERVTALALTTATLTPQVEEHVRWLLDEILVREQFGEKAFELVAYTCALEKEADVRLLTLVLDLTFQKLNDNLEIEVYNCVRLCEILGIQILPTLHDRKTLDPNGQPVRGRSLFLKYLHDRFHLQVEQAWRTRESLVSVSGRSPEDSKMTERAIKLWLNLLVFADALWGRYMLSESELHYVIDKQLSASKPTDSEIGQFLSFVKPNSRLARDATMKDRMDAHFSRVRTMLESSILSSASSDMILSILPNIATISNPSGLLEAPKQESDLKTSKLEPQFLTPDMVKAPDENRLIEGNIGAGQGQSTAARGITEQLHPLAFDSALLEDNTFQITATTPLTFVVAFFTQFAGTPIEDYTSELKNASYISSDPIITSSLSDIYRATLRKGTHIAVKCVRTAVSGNQKVLKHTVKELGVWSTLRHANILQLLGVALFKDRLAMVSEWMEQGSIISSLKGQPDVDRYALCLQVVKVVAWLHEQKLIHGDLKGANILMSGDGVPKLTDFGLAIMQEGVLKFSTTYQGGGTMRWMAPELFLNNPARSYKTDVYALGMTILEILTCQDPFQEIQNGHEIVYVVTVKKKTPRRPEYLAEKTPRNEIFWAAMRRCWVHEPNGRATAQDIADLLVSAGEDGSAKDLKTRNSLCCTMA